MLNSQKIKIGGREVTVNEIRVKQVLALLPFTSAGQPEGKEEAGFLKKFEALLLEGCGMTPDELGELHGSELELLWKTFREVNPFFFRTANQLNLEKPLAELAATIVSAYGEMYASLFAGATSTVSSTGLAGLLELLQRSTGPTEPT